MPASASPGFHPDATAVPESLLDLTEVSPMTSDRIDFISAYCDRWCERCAFTDRCSVYACRIAAEMCGDFREGLELALGPPHPIDGEPQPTVSETLLAELRNVTITPDEIAQFERAHKERHARLKAHPLTRMSDLYASRAWEWLQANQEPLAASADPVVREALEVVSWDAHLIGAKIHRALTGRDCVAQGEDEDDDPVQNDWNGSAKVALLSLQRSEAAWRTIAAATGDPTPSVLADGASRLRQALEEAFPSAMAFIRPGFDQAC
jgi:hypothetical protein